MSPEFVRHNREMLDAAERCIQLRQHLPTLVLIYTHVDTLAWAGSQKRAASVRTRFEEWVSTWMLPWLAAEAPTLTPTDLYAARCGVLHTLTASSALSDVGQAKVLAYAWGTAKAQVLNDALSSSNVAGQVVTLHYETLLRALREGYEQFIASAELDGALQQRLEDAAGKHYRIFQVKE